MMIDFKKVRRKIEYDPRRYTSKTVLWFTREEIKTLKSCSGCNVIMFSLIIIILLICLILFLTRSYPFTVVEARIVHTSFGSILLLQAAISILGYYAVRAENPCIIDVYCVMNSILIASQIGLLVIFSNFAENRVLEYFKHNLLLQVIVIINIIINAIMIPAAFVVELQIRTHGSVEHRKILDHDEGRRDTTASLDRIAIPSAGGRRSFFPQHHRHSSLPDIT